MDKNYTEMCRGMACIFVEVIQFHEIHTQFGALKNPSQFEPSKLLSICSPLNSSQFGAPLNPFQFCIEDKTTCCPPIIRPLASLLREYCEAQVLQFAHTRSPLNQLIEFPAECN